MDYSLKRIKVLGITRDFTQCECCGKPNLSKTVSILDLETEAVFHFGVVCAAKADKYDTLEALNLAKKEIRQAVYNYEQQEKDAAVMAHRHLKKIYGGYYDRAQGVMLNCSEEIYQECKKQCFEHLSKPFMSRGPFVFKTKNEGNENKLE
jgi:fructose 1,6-bisphosphatase